MLRHVEQSGRSMIEMIGYICIMIVVTVAAASVVSSGMYKFRSGRINQELTDLKKVISQRYVAAENYKDVKMETLCEEKIGPYNVVPHKRNNNCSSKGVHAFGGTVTIGQDNNGETFFIRFEQLSEGICAELGAKLWLVNDGSDLDRMQINNETWAWRYSNTVENPVHLLPARIGEVQLACTKKGYNNVITWYFN